MSKSSPSIDIIRYANIVTIIFDQRQGPPPTHPLFASILLIFDTLIFDQNPASSPSPPPICFNFINFWYANIYSPNICKAYTDTYWLIGSTNICKAYTPSPLSPPLRPPCPPFALVFDFSYYICRCFPSFCSRKVLNTDLESWGQYESKKKSKLKSDHYSLRNRENKKHKFADGLVREGGNASLVVGVTSVRARPPANLRVLFLRLRRL